MVEQRLSSLHIKASCFISRSRLMVRTLIKGYPVKDTVSNLQHSMSRKRSGFESRLWGQVLLECQQENVTLSRFLRRTEIVEGNGFNSQLLGRVASVTGTTLDGSQVISIVLEVRLGGR